MREFLSGVESATDADRQSLLGSADGEPSEFDRSGDVVDGAVFSEDCAGVLVPSVDLSVSDRCGSSGFGVDDWAGVGSVDFVREFSPEFSVIALGAFGAELFEELLEEPSAEPEPGVSDSTVALSGADFSVVGAGAPGIVLAPAAGTTTKPLSDPASRPNDTSDAEGWCPSGTSSAPTPPTTAVCEVTGEANATMAPPLNTATALVAATATIVNELFTASFCPIPRDGRGR